MNIRFAERAKELRIEHGLNQVELGDKLGLSKQIISNYENGKRVPDIQTILDIATYFDVSIDYLLGKTDYKKPEYESFEKRTTLSDGAIAKLEKIEFDSDTLNLLIETDKFQTLIDTLSFYLLNDDTTFSNTLQNTLPVANGIAKDNTSKFIKNVLNIGFEKFTFSQLDEIIKQIAKEMRESYISNKEAFNQKFATEIKEVNEAFQKAKTNIEGVNNGDDSKEGS